MNKFIMAVVITMACAYSPFANADLINIAPQGEYGTAVIGVKKSDKNLICIINPKDPDHPGCFVYGKTPRRSLDGFDIFDADIVRMKRLRPM